MSESSGGPGLEGRVRGGVPLVVLAALCLMTGLVVSVGLAWVGAAYSVQPGTTPRAPFASWKVGAGDVPRRVIASLPKLAQYDYEVEPVRSTARGWLVKRELIAVRMVKRPAPGPIGGAAPAAPAGEIGTMLPAPSRRTFGMVQSRDPIASVERYFAGWPLRALEWTHSELFSPGAMAGTGPTGLEAAWERGIEYGATRAGVVGVDEWRRLPIRPSRGGLGLVVNTLVWGVIAGFAFAVPGVVRRQRRRTRGACVECGYPVRDASGSSLQQCPECGTVVKPPSMPDTGSPA